MTIAELIEILKTYDLNAVVVLAGSAGEKENSGWRACGSERYSRPTFTGSSARVCLGMNSTMVNLQSLAGGR